MRLFCRLILMCLPLSLAAAAHAEIYKYYDRDGNLVLSDAVPEEQAEKAEKLQSKEIMTLPAVKPKHSIAKSAKAKTASQAKAAYAIVIQSPAPDAAYSREEGDVPVAVSIAPALARGHRLELMLDGRLAQSLSAIPAARLESSAHELEARVIDESGEVLQSAKVKFHLRHQGAIASPQVGQEVGAAGNK